MNKAAMTVGVIGFAISSLTCRATGTDPANGEQLHAAKCTTCHDSTMYTRPERRVSSLEQLDAQVRFCANANNTEWFDDEIEDVVHYLNQAYYKFSER